jgi:hypothetical protein
MILSVSLLGICIIAHMIAVQHQNYVTPLTDAGIDYPQTPVLPSEPAQTEPQVNPDGTKNFTVDLVLHITTKFEIGGSYFNNREYIIFFIATSFEEYSFELLKNLRDNYVEILLTFIAVTTIPAILLHKCRIK